MKKALLTLLCAILLLPLLAGTSSAVSTQDITVQAFRPSEDGQITVNGSTDELYWLLDTPVGSSILGVLYDGYGVYLAFETQADSAVFTINGAVITCTLGDTPSTTVGLIAGQDGIYELRVGYTQFSMKPQLGNSVSFSAAIGSDTVSGTLVFSGRALAPAGTGKDLTGADIYTHLNKYTADDNGGITVTSDGLLTFSNRGSSYYSLNTKPTSQWGQLSNSGLLISFNACFNDLPTTTSTSKNLSNFGVFFFLKPDADTRHDMAFWADANGQIRFAALQSSTANTRNNALATGIYLDTPQAQNVRIRILLDRSNNITLFINGVEVGTLAACPAPTTNALPQLAFYADNRTKSTDRGIDATFSDFSVKELAGAEARKLYSMGIALFSNDDNPVALKSSAYSVNRLVTLDTTHNSVMLDQGSSKYFNRVTLYDIDEVSRVSQNDLGLFVSNTGKADSWVKVTGWQLHQSGNAYTLYNIDQTARYVKVHCYLDNLNQSEDPVAFAPSFTNYVADLITVEYDPYLLGADSAFTHSGTVTLRNPADAELHDHPVRLTLSQIGAKAGEYQSSCADFRFAIGSQQLPHWYDGEGGFYVRVPSISAEGDITITTYWGNADAVDVSDRQATFEAVYGNVSLVDLSKKTDLASSGRAFTFPNGTVITVARNDGSELTAVYSYDGGRTFTPVGPDLIADSHWANKAGFGSFIWDESKQRLILMAYVAKVAVGQGYEAADCRFVMLYTDDYGVSWSAPRVLSDASATPIAANDIIIQNSQARRYQLSYCDGLTLKDADGAGPNVDYVLVHGYFRPNSTFAAAAIYSKDGGENWYASENDISMDVEVGNLENGISETALAQLDDGSLYIVARAQQEDNVYFYESYSYDYGNTWTESVPSGVIATNTSPVFLPYGNDRLLMWAGNNTLGGNARRRFPMTLAISGDNYQTYERSIDLTLGTAFDSMDSSIEWMTQPSLSVSADGSEAFVCWTNRCLMNTEAMLIEEFDDMIYHTKGAFDGFEYTSLKGEGWLMGDKHVTGYKTHVAGLADITTLQARSGSRSMSLTDDSDSLPAYALRQIPSMRSGTIGISLYVPSTNTTDYVFELKHAFNYTYGQFTLAGFGVQPDGTVFLVNGSGKKTVGSVSTDCWNDFAIEFDMTGTKKGTLLVNGSTVATFDLNIQSDRITVVELSESAASSTTGSVVYADDFYAVDAAKTEFVSSSRIASGATTVQAFRPSTNGQITVNGIADELYWLLDTPVGNSKLGALCDDFGLYLAFETQATNASFTINGVTVNCVLDASPTASVGTIAGKNGVYELKLTYAQLGMAPVVTAELPFESLLGYHPITGTLVLSSHGIAPAGTGLDLTGTDFYNGSSTSAGPNEFGGITVTEDGVFTFTNNGDNYFNLNSSTSTSSWGNLSSKGLLIAFNACFNDLPTTTDTSKNPGNFGLFFYVITGDKTVRSDLAFWSDAGGQIMFTAKKSSVAASRSNTLATGIYLDTEEAQNVQVRILLDAAGRPTLYLNGVEIGTLEACPAPTTNAVDRIAFFADNRKRTSDRGIDVILSDFAVKDLAGTEPMVAVETFKGAAIVPEAKDQVFAGFFRDTEHTSAHEGQTGYAYTKFVPKGVLSVKAQISANTTAQSASTSMRFLTTVDTLYYREVGFYITMGGETQKIRSSTVYSMIVANDGGVAFPYSPTIFHDQSNYFMTFTLTQIPQAQFDSDITITPYWVTLDGTECKGVTNTLRVSMGFAAN